jgi:PAS domain S-box-containing protein
LTRGGWLFGRVGRVEYKEMGTEPTASPGAGLLHPQNGRPADLSAAAARKLEAILDAITFGATRIGTPGPWQRHVPELLMRLGQAAEVSRVSLFEVHTGPDGRPVESCRFDWAEPGLARLSNDPRYRNIPITDETGETLDDWSTRRARGEIVKARRSETSGLTRQIFEEHDTYTFISVPIFVGPRWWGFLGFDDCQEEHTWSDLEARVLKIAASLIGGAIGRAEAERELRASQHRYTLAALGSNDGLWEWDIRGRGAFLSNQCRRILGLPLGDDFEAFQHLLGAMRPARGGRLEDHLAACFNNRRRRFEVECLWPGAEPQAGGAPSWIVLRGIILYGIGEPQRVVGSLRDITDRKHAQLELERMEHLLRTVIDSVPALINVKDTESRYVMMNRFQGELYGVDPRDAVGRTSSDFVGEEYGQRSRDYDLEVLQSGIAQPFTERDFVDVNGELHTWYTAKSPLFDPDPETADGKPIGVITVALDVAELKAAERARANLSRYVAPALVDLMATAEQPFGPPRQEDAAVLFADLIGFTSLSETWPPQEVFSLLREFHEHAARTVFDTGGTLIKFTGDGIMATFGLPTKTARDATDALACARALVTAVERMNAGRKLAALPGARVAVGVHYGPVLIGALGSDRRTEVAVVGDTVNVANRLERLVRSANGDIAVSQALVEAVKREADGAADSALRLLEGFAPLPPRRLRGRKEATDIWILATRPRDKAKPAAPRGDAGGTTPGGRGAPPSPRRAG